MKFPNPDDIIMPDPQLNHLKAMAAIMRMIETLAPDTVIEIRVGQNGGWTISRHTDDRTFDVDRDSISRPYVAPEPYAARVIDHEIEQREHDAYFRRMP